MADTLVESEVVPARRSRRPVIVTLTLVVALIAGVLWLGWWVTHPNRFGTTNGQGFTVSSGTRAVDSTVLFGDLDSPSGPVTLLSAQPVITVNSADASVDVLLCTSSGQALGAGGGPLSDWCSAVRPVHGVTYRGIQGAEAGGQEYLLVVVTPHWPGKVQVEGVRVHYRDGLRTGTQVIGGTYIVPAR